MSATEDSKNLTNKEIKAHPEYSKAMKRCRENLRGDFAHNVIGFCLSGLEKKIGKKAVGLLATELPKIKNIVKIPQEYIKLAAEES